MKFAIPVIAILALVQSGTSLVQATTTSQTTTILASATTTASSTPFNDGSICAVGPGTNRTGLTSIFVDSPFSTKSCNVACSQGIGGNGDALAGINYSAVVQTGPYITCFCLVQFKPTNRAGCSSCVTSPDGNYYPQSNFANCGVQDLNTGYISLLAVTPVATSSLLGPPFSLIQAPANGTNASLFVNSFTFVSEGAQSKSGKSGEGSIITSQYTTGIWDAVNTAISAVNYQVLGSDLLANNPGCQKLPVNPQSTYWFFEAGGVYTNSSVTTYDDSTTAAGTLEALAAGNLPLFKNLNFDPSTLAPYTGLIQSALFVIPGAATYEMCVAFNTNSVILFFGPGIPIVKVGVVSVKITGFGLSWAPTPQLLFNNVNFLALNFLNGYNSPQTPPNIQGNYWLKFKMTLGLPPNPVNGQDIGNLVFDVDQYSDANPSDQSYAMSLIINSVYLKAYGSQFSFVSGVSIVSSNETTDPLTGGDSLCHPSGSVAFAEPTGFNLQINSQLLNIISLPGSTNLTADFAYALNSANFQINFWINFRIPFVWQSIQNSAFYGFGAQFYQSANSFLGISQSANLINFQFVTSFDVMRKAMYWSVQNPCKIVCSGPYINIPLTTQLQSNPFFKGASTISVCSDTLTPLDKFLLSATSSSSSWNGNWLAFTLQQVQSIGQLTPSNTQISFKNVGSNGAFLMTSSNIYVADDLTTSGTGIGSLYIVMDTHISIFDILNEQVSVTLLNGVLTFEILYSNPLFGYDLLASANVETIISDVAAGNGDLTNADWYFSFNFQLSGLAQDIISDVTNGVNTALSAIFQSWDAFTSFSNDIYNAISNIFQNVLTDLSGDFNKISSYLQTGLVSDLNTFKSQCQSLSVTGASWAAASAAGSLINLGQSAGAELQNTFGSAYNNAIGLVNSAANDIQNGFSAVENFFSSWKRRQSPTSCANSACFTNHALGAAQVDSLVSQHIQVTAALNAQQAQNPAAANLYKTGQKTYSGGSATSSNAFVSQQKVSTSNFGAIPVSVSISAPALSGSGTVSTTASASFDIRTSAGKNASYANLRSQATSSLSNALLGTISPTCSSSSCAVSAVIGTSSTLSLNCPSGQFVKVNKATVSSAKCQGNVFDVTSSIGTICSSNSTCSVVVDAWFKNGVQSLGFWDPCPTQTKLVQVTSYSCVATPSTVFPALSPPIQFASANERQIISISCQNPTYIRVINATYGSIHSCPNNMIDFTSVVKQRCLTGACNILVAAQSINGVTWPSLTTLVSDPCPGIVKTFSIYYQCIPNYVVGQYRATSAGPVPGTSLLNSDGTGILSCPNNQYVAINAAAWGSNCNAASNYLPYLLWNCNAAFGAKAGTSPQCFLGPTKYYAGSPCPVTSNGPVEILDVLFSCATHAAWAQQGQTLTLDCSSQPGNQYITIQSASWGHPGQSTSSLPTCAGNYVDITTRVNAACSTAKTCRLSVSQGLVSGSPGGTAPGGYSLANIDMFPPFYDPCPNFGKYVNVQYSCSTLLAGVKVLSVSQSNWGNPSLTCPAGQIISVVAASFGTSCQSVDVSPILVSLCNGQQTCAIGGSGAYDGYNKAYPCYGTVKNLDVTYSCGY